MVLIKTLPDLRQGARYIIVGDVHGCSAELDRLLMETAFRPGFDVLVLVGDLVNKGYDDEGVVRRAMKYNAVCVLGNHDMTLIHVVQELTDGTLKCDPEDALHISASKFPKDCLDYLCSLPHIVRIPQFNVVVVHAGLRPGVSLDKQNLWELLHMRRIAPDNMGIDAQSGGTLWAKLWQGPEFVIFGHDAMTGLQREPYALGLDTGCVYGNVLTAFILPGNQLINVPGSKVPAKKRKKTGPGSPAGKESPGTTPPSNLMSVAAAAAGSDLSWSNAGKDKLKAIQDTKYQDPTPPTPAVTRSSALAAMPASPQNSTGTAPPPYGAPPGQGQSQKPVGAQVPAGPAGGARVTPSSLSPAPEILFQKAVGTPVTGAASGMQSLLAKMGVNATVAPSPTTPEPPSGLAANGTPAGRPATTTPGTLTANRPVTQIPTAPVATAPTAPVAAKPPLPNVKSGSITPPRSSSASSAALMLKTHLLTVASSFVSSGKVDEAITLLEGFSDSTIKDDLLQDESIPALLWASLLLHFSRCVRFGTARGRAVAAMNWIQDIALSTEALEHVDRKEVVDNLKMIDATLKGDGPALIGPKLIQATLLAVR